MKDRRFYWDSPMLAPGIREKCFWELYSYFYSYFQDPDPVVTQSSPPPTFPIISNLSDIWLPDISSQIRVLLLIDFSLTRRVSNLAAPASTDVALMERATELQGSVVAEESKALWSELDSKLDLPSRWLRSSSNVEVIQGFVTLFCDWLDL